MESEQQHFELGRFDISNEAYSDFGVMSYLYGIGAARKETTMSNFLYRMETPWRLQQYKIYRSNGFPRAFLTWAILDVEAEYKFAIDGVHFGHDKWQSGKSFWIIDFVAPFGHAKEIRNQFENLAVTLDGKEVRRVRSLMQKSNTLGDHSISQWHRNNAGKVKHSVFSKNALEKKLRKQIDG